VLGALKTGQLLFEPRFAPDGVNGGEGEGVKAQGAGGIRRWVAACPLVGHHVAGKPYSRDSLTDVATARSPAERSLSGQAVLVSGPAPVAPRLRRWNGKPSRKGTGFQQPSAPHEHWHIDVSYLNICSNSKSLRTFYYLCSVLDGHSRSIVRELSEFHGRSGRA